MTDSGNADAARQIAEAFGGLPVGDARGLVADDYIDHQGIGSGPLVGRQAFLSLVRESRAAQPKQTVTVADLFTSGSFVAMRLQWQTVRSDGARADRETIEILRFADGRAVEHWGFRTS